MLAGDTEAVRGMRPTKLGNRHILSGPQKGWLPRGGEPYLRSALSAALRKNQRPVFAQVFGAQLRHRDVSSASWLMVVLDEPSVIRFLPNRKSRAGCAPSIHYLRVRTGIWTYPLEQVENEGI